LSSNDREYEQETGADTAPTLAGGFAYDRETDRWTWSTEVYRIHGFEPHDVVPTTELIRYHLHPDDGDVILVKLWRAMEAGVPFSEHFRVVDAQGTTRNVLTLGTGETGGRIGAGLRGQMIDVSDIHHQILREDVGSAVEDFEAHRAIIEQAKGILMARHSIDAEQAFLRLRDHSQHKGNKLADVAAAIVESHLLLVPATPAAS